MPDGPRPPDVEFDDAAAAAAIAELSAARRVLTEANDVRTTSTDTASDEFRGAYADNFTETSSGLDEEATAAAEGMTVLQSKIEAAVQAAADRRREVQAAQAAWDSEAEAERRAREQYPNIPI